MKIIQRSWPKLTRWQLTFEIRIDEAKIPLPPAEIPEVLFAILTEAGRRIGVGHFRPEKMGPFGKYEIADWQVTENTA